MIGPIEQIRIAGGATADLYLLRFDKNGRLLSPKTARMAVDAARQASDVFLFSHGWNNIYADALERYRGFAKGFVKQRASLGLPAPAGYRPVLIGMIWPATWFVLPWERGPDIAAGNPGGELDEAMLAEVTDTMSPEQAERFTELMDGTRALSEAEAAQAADLVRSALWPDEDADGASKPPDTAAVLSSWRAMSEEDMPFVDEDEQVGTVGGTAGGSGAGRPATAGGVDFDPRDLLRMGSVWKMKARAGTVGTNGVGPLLSDLLRESSARTHLVGHSFGARVMLSAVASQNLPRKVHSMLLLQPAVNRWCFARDVARTGKVGGYHSVLDGVEQPIVTTLSKSDKPLHEFFHLAVRGDSLGEVDTAAVGDTHRYGALGGYGPAGLGALGRSEPAREPGKTYDLRGPERVLAIDGSLKLNGAPAISGHGDINNPVTWWALHCLVSANQ